MGQVRCRSGRLGCSGSRDGREVGQEIGEWDGTYLKYAGRDKKEFVIWLLTSYAAIFAHCDERQYAQWYCGNGDGRVSQDPHARNDQHIGLGRRPVELLSGI